MTPFCQADIEAEEGFEAFAYPDPLSPLAKACEAAGLLNTQYRQLSGWQSLNGQPWTDGYGNASADIGPDSIVTQPEAASFVYQRIGSIAVHLGEALPWFTSIDDGRADVLINMAYELGVSGLLAFKQTLAYIAASEFDLAGQEMLNSTWATQVPDRAHRLALQMQTGGRAS